MQNRNKPFTFKDVEELERGFNSSGPFMNRRSRKAKFKNRLPIHHIQWVRIKDKKTKEYLLDDKGNYEVKKIIHYKTPPKTGGI